MKKLTFSLIGLILCSIYSVQALAWEESTKKLFEDDEYEQVIEIAKDHKKDKASKLGLMLLTLSHLQKYELNGTKSDRTKYKNYLEVLEDNVTVSHLEDIQYFIELTDKPEVVKVAQKVLKQAFKNIHEAKYITKLIKFAKSDNKETRKIALNTIKRLMKPKRKYVLKGGTLRDEDILPMQDEKLIRALLEQAKNSKARDILIMIERPALAYIGDYEGKAINKIEQKILKAIAKREKKYPESFWYSATGKVKSSAAEFGDYVEINE